MTTDETITAIKSAPRDEAVRILMDAAHDAMDRQYDTIGDDRDETRYRCDPDEPEDTRDPRDEYDGGIALRFINF